MTPVDDRPARRRGHRRAARLARRAGPFRRPDRRRSRASATPSWTRATRRRSWPGWAAAASRRTSCTGRSARSRATSTLRILDSTDPAYVSATLDDLDPLRTLFLIASKSGTTTEPNAFLAYAWDAPRPALKAVPHHAYEHPGAYFAVITDPGKSARRSPITNDFREIFLNPPDIGGRYSALTYVGLVPASLIGIDLDAAPGVGLGDARRLPRAGSGDEPGRLAGARHRDAGQGRPGQADVPDRRRDRRASGRGSSSSSPRAPASTASASCRWTSSRSARSRPTARTGRSSGSPWPASDGGGARRARRRARGGRPPGHPDRHRRPDRPRRRVRPLGGRDSDRRGGPRHRPVRPAQRRGGQAADPRRPRRVGRARRRRAAATPRRRSRPATA